MIRSIGNRSHSSASVMLCFGDPRPDADSIFERMASGLADVGFTVPRNLLADVAVDGAPTRDGDGAISFQSGR